MIGLIRAHNMHKSMTHNIVSLQAYLIVFDTSLCIYRRHIAVSTITTGDMWMCVDGYLPK